MERVAETAASAFARQAPWNGRAGTSAVTISVRTRKSGQSGASQAPAPLTADENDLAGHVTRVLADSRTEQLALDGHPHDREREQRTHELEAAREQLAERETRVEALRDERGETHWWQRGRRQQLDRITEGWQRAVDHWQAEVDRLTATLPERPAAPQPALTCAHDPLAALEPERDLARELQRRRLERELSRGLDLGIDR